MTIKGYRDKPESRIKKSCFNIALIAVIAVSIVTFSKELSDVSVSRGSDFGCTIAAVRHLMQGFDPYFIKMNMQESLTLSGEVNTPAILPLFYAIARLPYGIIRYVWFALSWILLLASIQMFARCAQSPNRAKLIWVVSLFFISFNYAWHLQRGQKYVIFLFLLSLAYWLSQKRFKGKSIASGFVLGCLITFRPVMIFLCIPLLIFRKWKLFAGALVGVVCSITLSVTIIGAPIWKSYSMAMEQWHTTSKNALYGGNQAYRHADTLEDMYDDIVKFSTVLNTDIPFIDASFRVIFKKHLSPQVLLTIFILIVLIVIIVFLQYRHLARDIPLNLIFLVGIGLVLLSDHFLLAHKWNYTNILWIAPFPLTIISVESLGFFLRPTTILLLPSLFPRIPFVSTFHNLLLAELAMLFYFMFITVTFLKRYAKLQKA